MTDEPTSTEVTVATESQPTRPGLTELQSAFVDAFVANGGNGAQAAITAGYSENGAPQTAHKLLRNPLIAQAIQHECTALLARTAPKALGTLTRLMSGARSELVQLQAAQDWLDRSGFKPVDRKALLVAGELKVSIDLSE